MKPTNHSPLIPSSVPEKGNKVRRPLPRDAASPSSASVHLQMDIALDRVQGFKAEQEPGFQPLITSVNMPSCTTKSAHLYGSAAPDHLPQV